jgi:hypothetical protein
LHVGLQRHAKGFQHLPAALDPPPSPIQPATKKTARQQPANIYEFGAKYFADLAASRGGKEAHHGGGAGGGDGGGNGSDGGPQQ